MHTAITSSYSFDDEQLGYVDFLESLVRIAQSYPFTDEELTDIVSFEDRMNFFINKLNEKFAQLQGPFQAKMSSRSIDMQYVPRVIVDGDEDDDMVDV